MEKKKFKINSINKLLLSWYHKSMEGLTIKDVVQGQLFNMFGEKSVSSITSYHIPIQILDEVKINVK